MTAKIESNVIGVLDYCSLEMQDTLPSIGNSVLRHWKCVQRLYRNWYDA